MAAPGASRTLAELIASEAPLPGRRATSVMVAVARALTEEESTGHDHVGLTPSAVSLHADGGVSVHGELRRLPPRDDETAPAEGTEGGAALGRLLFATLTGRPPLSREDAFEPAVREALGPELCALMARSFSDAPGQWPDADTWLRALESHAGAHAPPLAPALAATRRRRRLIVTAAAAALVLASLLALALAPRWWDSAVEGGAPVDGSEAVPGWDPGRLDPGDGPPAAGRTGAATPWSQPERASS